MMVKPRVIILPGNGAGDVWRANWYGTVHKQLVKSDLFSEVVLRNMPDPSGAKEEVWVPFTLKELGADANTILIGHSSGAVAALRLLEKNKLLGCLLVSACWTDLGDENERESGYYSRPWPYATIRSNCNWMIQYHSSDDPFIPQAEADHVAAGLGLKQGEVRCLSIHSSSKGQSKRVL